MQEGNVLYNAMNNQSQKEINILVTGGVGFIGSYLIEKLLEEGYEVFCLDNFKKYKIY